MQTIAINGSPRAATGKKASKADRRDGQIPCVMYGGDDVVHFKTTLNEVKNLIFTPDFKVADVTVNGSSHRCIVRDIQFHPVKDTVRHIDFLRLIDGNPVKLELPVRFVGSAPGEKSGGKLIQALRRIKVKTIPEKIVDALTLDISELELGQAIRIRDIQPEEGIEIMNPPGTPVASVQVPRALRSAEEEAAEEELLEEGAEGEEGTEGEAETKSEGESEA